MEDFFRNIPENSKFMYSSFNQYTNTDIIEFLEEQGVETKVERGRRVFPVSDSAKDVLKALTNRLKELNIKIRTNFKVDKIITEDQRVVAVQGTNERANTKEQILADKIILATGGKSYPVTGSTGDGYKLAEELGHTITKLRASLVPLKCDEQKSKKLCQTKYAFLVYRI